MRIENFGSYGCAVYRSSVTCKDAYRLGDVVINSEKEIGVIIQVHEPGEFRADMFGNVSASEIRLATDEEINQHRPDILKQGTFYHI